MNQFSVTPEMLARYVVNRQKDLEALKNAWAEKDFSMIASKAHNMKGSAESFGFPELGVIGNNLEDAALAQKEADVQLQIALIEEWLNNCLTPK